MKKASLKDTAIFISFIFSNFLEASVGLDRNVQNNGVYHEFKNFSHGLMQNLNGGSTCLEFLALNSLNKCCSYRDDDCYMVSYLKITIKPNHYQTDPLY